MTPNTFVCSFAGTAGGNVRGSAYAAAGIYGELCARVRGGTYVFCRRFPQCAQKTAPSVSGAPQYLQNTATPPLFLLFYHTDTALSSPEKMYGRRKGESSRLQQVFFFRFCVQPDPLCLIPQSYHCKTFCISGLFAVSEPVRVATFGVCQFFQIFEQPRRHELQYFFCFHQYAGSLFTNSSDNSCKKGVPYRHRTPFFPLFCFSPFHRSTCEHLFYELPDTLFKAVYFPINCLSVFFGAHTVQIKPAVIRPYL